MYIKYIFLKKIIAYSNGIQLSPISCGKGFQSKNSLTMRFYPVDIQLNKFVRILSLKQLFANFITVYSSNIDQIY